MDYRLNRFGGSVGNKYAIRLDIDCLRKSLGNGPVLRWVRFEHSLKQLWVGKHVCIEMCPEQIGGERVREITGVDFNVDFWNSLLHRRQAGRVRSRFGAEHLKLVQHIMFGR